MRWHFKSEGRTLTQKHYEKYDEHNDLPTSVSLKTSPEPAISPTTVFPAALATVMSAGIMDERFVITESDRRPAARPLLTASPVLSSQVLPAVAAGKGLESFSGGDDGDSWRLRLLMLVAIDDCATGIWGTNAAVKGSNRQMAISFIFEKRLCGI